MAAGKHLILATVIDVHPGQVTYPACVTCYTKLHHLSTSNKFQCQRCGRLYEVSEVHHRYRLTIKVTSQSVCREVTVFGSCLDPFFGMDATAFARYTQHAAQYHQTAWNELDILHASLTNTLVGHPFYFGFKTAGNFFGQKGSRTASCVSLANITGRDSEGLVAVQMTSPFQKWNFPTVVQNLFRSISNRKGGPMEKGEYMYVQCSSKDECEICPLMAIPQNQTEEKVNSGHEAIDHPEKGGIDTQEILDLTSSRRDTTCDESCRTTSTLGETFFSCSIPSFRLSCDKTLTTINRTLHSQLSSDSISTKDHAEYFQYVGNKESNRLHMGDNIVGHQESRIHESKSVKETFSHTGKACTDVTLQEFVTKDELTEGSCQKKASMSGSWVSIVSGACDENIVHDLRGHTCIEENPVDTSDTCSKNSCKGMTSASRTSDHEQDATASIIQECEQFMNQWLEENSFDQWSYYGSIPDPGESHRDSPSHDNKGVKIGTHCREEDREDCEANRSCHPELSHSSSCPEFPDDLPFSEDLDQFLHGVEEEYAETREKEVRAHSHHSRIHQVKDESARTDGCEKEITTVSKADKSIRLEGESVSIVASDPEVSCHYERTDKDKNLCTGDVAQSCGNHKLGERCLIKSSSSASGSFKGETEANLCNAKERECEGIMMPDFKCNTFQEDGKEQQSIPQSCRDELTDWNTTKGKQLDDYICDDEGDDSVYSEILVQDEQVQSDSAWCEDYSQSPLLFSQSQSPILPVRPSRYLTSQQSRSQVLERSCSNDANNSLPIQHKETPPSRLGSNHRAQKPNRKADTPTDQVCERSDSENLLKVHQTCDQRTPDRKADVPKDQANQMSDDESSPEDLQIPDQGTPDRKSDTPKERTHQKSDIENSPVDLQSPNQGTPCLFSQAPHDSGIPSHPSSIPRNSRRMYHSRQKATPLRQLFLQRARFWKMSSTPMTSKKNIKKVERSFESPLSCGTPSLFSTENSPGVDNTSWNYDQGKHSKESFQKEVSGSLECTPDLF